MSLLPRNFATSQRNRLARFSIAECVDVHCHCLPGLDDGPATVAEAVELCRALVLDGVTTVIATPHQLGRFDGHVAADDIRRAAAELNGVLAAEGIPLSVVPGADVRVDERIPELLDEDRILTLADNRAYVLIELPPDTFINAEPLLEKLAVRRVTPILSHPERNSFLAREPRAALPWLTHGGLLQVTAGSLLGDFGPLAESAAWHWLATGAVALVGTDAHNTADRGPCITQAIETIARRLGNPLAYRTCLLNPLRVLSGKRIRPNAHLLRREMVR